MDVPREGELLVVRLREIHGAERAEHLADDVVTGVPVETEHHEVEGSALEQVVKVCMLARAQDLVINCTMQDGAQGGWLQNTAESC